MKQHPILFSTPMVQAILDGRKTMTRRVMKVQPEAFCGGVMRPLLTTCPYGWIGDRLWVRETWQQGQRNGSDLVLFYKASHEKEVDEDIKWKPSIFMPRWASRITLEITGVRVERLQEIKEKDAKAEGSPTLKGCQHTLKGYRYLLSFERLWDSINGKKYPWSSNPWVWVIKFKKL
jgi:hypothetical protein